ncbi:MAG TPA: hypothetical protein PKM57_10315 [Kiritimatiellia bacterium]|nr:hypothetical protein [Kiritimatiellia bacterium]HPS09032.1 hypothetical protein [Kiritimatiellia bacterium]
MKQLVSIIASVLLTHSLLANTYYVNAARPDDSGNGLSWDEAKKTIQAVVNAASIGDTVLVTNGVYNVGFSTINNDGTTYKNRVLVNKSITVRSINGPESTIIEGYLAVDNSAAIRCVYLSDGVLDGFTLRNGSTQYTLQVGYCEGAGVNMYGASATAEVKNCIICNCQAYKGGGAAFARLKNCTLLSNKGSERAGGVYESDLEYCTLSGNTTGGNGAGSFNSTLKSCIISGNTVLGNGGRGGGAYGGTFNNCLIINRCLGT